MTLEQFMVWFEANAKLFQLLDNGCIRTITNNCPIEKKAQRGFESLKGCIQKIGMSNADGYLIIYAADGTMLYGGAYGLDLIDSKQEGHMYTTRNFKTKAELKRAIEAGELVGVFQ